MRMLHEGAEGTQQNTAHASARYFVGVASKDRSKSLSKYSKEGFL